MGENLAICQIFTTFAPAFIKIGRWCNGNTTGFGSVIPGSNPSRPTTEIIQKWADIEKGVPIGTPHFLFTK